MAGGREGREEQEGKPLLKWCASTGRTFFHLLEGLERPLRYAKGEALRVMGSIHLSEHWNQPDQGDFTAVLVWVKVEPPQKLAF